PVSRDTALRLKGILEPNSRRDRIQYDTLTRRQREVMHLLVLGLSYKAVGSKLSISPRTVEGHRNEIMKVLELTNTVELTRYAARLGLIEPGRRELRVGR
ncbi:MAG: LuxR C-terminal-related transcriptional regulator, partial [Pseudomonadota bacterium]